MKKIYYYRVKEGSYQIMATILKYPVQVDERIDGKICRVTVTSYTIKDNIKKEYTGQYSNDNLFQIEVQDIEDKEFLIMASLLENLDEVVITNDQL